MNSILRFVVLSALIIALTWAWSGPVAAHTGFASSNPPDGSVISATLDEVIIRFTGPAEPAGEGFVILDSSDVPRSPDLVSSDAERKAWTLHFDPPLSGGTIGVRWTVQAPDAHPINGSFSFTIEVLPAEAEPQSYAGDRTSAQSEIGPPITGQPAGDADLAAFLAGPHRGAAPVEQIGALGRLAALTGTLAGLGALAFAVAVLRGNRRDVVSVQRLIRYAGVLVLVGAAAELTTQLASTAGSWTGAWSAAETVLVAPFGTAIALRVIGGLSLYSLAAIPVPWPSRWVPGATSEPVLVGAGGSSQGLRPVYRSSPHPVDHGTMSTPPVIGPLSKSTPLPNQSIALPLSGPLLLGTLAVLASYAFDGHTVREGAWLVTGLVDAVHVLAGAVWAGGVTALALVLWRRYRRQEPLRALELAVRFSVLASAALTAAGVAGAILVFLILDAPSQLWTTSWGALLVAKVGMVLVAAALGAYNHFTVIPWMHDDPHDDARANRLRLVVTAEAMVLAAVVALTALLIGASSTPT
ncbi:MAG: CopD family protein [Acidimicrobiia bacterium]|nr:CopD family protein [Acidimicrobiia bacterium]